MPLRRSSLKYCVNEQFFDRWNRQVTYILGFTFADGNIYKTSLSWDIQNKDLELLKKFNKILLSNYPITFHRNSSCRLRINNQIFISGAIAKGLLPKKNIRNILPLMPKYFLRHFVRGYLDGDGWIVIREKRNEINVGFASGNGDFLEDLNQLISKELSIRVGKVRAKVKITKSEKRSITYQLEFYSTQAFKLADWIYGNLTNKDIFLDRKYEKYLEAKALHLYLKSGSRKVRIIQKTCGRNIDDILGELYFNEKLDGVQIAKVLGVHSSSVYRWLALAGIKYPEPRKYGNK